MNKKVKRKRVKKEHKQMSNIDKCMLAFLATLIVYLAIILPIRLCVIAFSWHWFVFGLVAVIIPFAFINFQLVMQKKLILTDEQNKNANIVIIKYILYFWFLDCLYMTIFNQWKIWVYILGIITLIKIFYSLTNTFLGKKQKNTILDLSLIFDLLLGIALTVYLIFLIPDQFTNLQTIVTTIVAAVYGGLLTLVGVAWTIRKGDKDRKGDLEQRDKEKIEEERKKYKPIFNVFVTAYSGILADIPEAFFQPTDGFLPYSETEQCNIWNEIAPFLIHNMDFSSFYVYGFKINDIIVAFSSYRFVDKNKFVRITFPNVFFTPRKVENISILVVDLLDNIYDVNLNFESKEIVSNPATGNKYKTPRNYYVIVSNGRAKLTDIKVDI